MSHHPKWFSYSDLVDPDLTYHRSLLTTSISDREVVSLRADADHP